MATSTVKKFLAQWKVAYQSFQSSEVSTNLALSSASLAVSNLKKKKKKTKSRWIPLSEFTLFPELPVELRLIIWKMSMDDLESQRVVISRSPSGLRVKCNPPVMLHLCFDSRSVARTRYHAEFANNLGKGQAVYFDFSKDALQFGDYEALQQFFGLRRLENTSAPCTGGSRALTKSLKYLIAGRGEDERSGVAFNFHQQFNHIGQPEYIFLARHKGPNHWWDRGEVASIKRAQLQGVVGNITRQFDAKDGKSGGIIGTLPARAYTSTAESLNFKEIKERIHVLENGPRPPKRVKKAGMTQKKSNLKETTGTPGALVSSMNMAGRLSSGSWTYLYVPTDTGGVFLRK